MPMRNKTLCKRMKAPRGILSSSPMQCMGRWRKLNGECGILLNQLFCYSVEQRFKGQKRNIKEIRGNTVSLGLRWRDAWLGVCSEAEKEEFRMVWVHKSC